MISGQKPSALTTPNPTPKTDEAVPPDGYDAFLQVFDSGAISAT